MKLSKDAVYEMLRAIPKGKVTTYKLLANSLNCKAYRAVGQILRQNPDAPRTPCHRVVAADGTIGGFMGTRNGNFIRKKKLLLEGEGIKFKGNKIIDFEQILFSSFKE